MAQDYQIRHVGEPHEWSNKYGKFLQFPITFAGAEGEPTQWSRKCDSKTGQLAADKWPKAGDSVFGSIEDTDHGPKFKLETRPDDMPAPQSAPVVDQTAPAMEAAAPPQAPVPAPTPTQPAQAPQEAARSLSSTITEKDRLIVAQVCTKAAVELHAAELGTGEMAMPERVKALAAQIEHDFWAEFDGPPF